MATLIKLKITILQLMLTLVAFGSKQSLAGDDSSFESRHAFWGEFAGMGYSLASAQYEIRLHGSFGLLTGINLYPLLSQSVRIPIAATFRVPFLAYFDLPNHQIEVDLGTIYVSEGHRRYPDLNWGIVAGIGYRYHPRAGGFVFRFMLNLFSFGNTITHSGRGSASGAPGLSFGYAF